MTRFAFRQYALLGSGRVARHMRFYLKQLQLPVVFWSRNGNPDFNSFPESDATKRLQKTLEQASHVLLAVSDQALKGLASQVHSEQTAVHFSGALQVPRVFAAHPLMTFGANLQSESWYRQIPFVVDHGHSLADLLPGVPNPSYPLLPKQRSYYHALCSLAGNSTFLLWSRVAEEFAQQLALPPTILAPFFHQVVENAVATSSADPARNFTGPVARKDWTTVRRHLDSLHERPDLLEAYLQYLKMAQGLGHQLPESVL